MSSVPSTARRRWIFLALLVALHLVFFLGPGNPLARWLFLSHIGIGLLWQPFVQPRRRIGPGGSVLVVLSAALLAYFLSWNVLLLWTMLLTGVVGGKVFMFPDRWERLFHLMALGYLVLAVLALILPAALLPFNLAEPVLSRLVIYVAPLMFIFMAALPVKHGMAEERAEIVDFVYGVFVVLLLAVIVLGSLSFALLFKVSYLEAQLMTLAMVAGVLMLLGFIWNPRAGFAGLGSAVAQHVMSLGLPVEEWLKSLAELAKHEEDPDRFLALACAELPQRLPGVMGGQWMGVAGQNVFGQTQGHRTRLAHGRLQVELVTRAEPSPALRWHYDLVVRLLAEFYLGKWRAQEVKRLSYIEAIHETGARLTHDVKNLLQSLDTLCVAAEQEGAVPSTRFNELLRRQLPEVSARLRQTLDKLAAPEQPAQAQPIPAANWLASLESRYADGQTTFAAVGDAATCVVADAALFSSVVENLLQNIADKRRSVRTIKAEVRLICGTHGARIEVRDDGLSIPAAQASKLLHQRVSSENGLGIGLYQCARQAEQAGFRLDLAENRDGCVRFRLAPAK
jgi:signal transduction histidine kinase